jgi:hypothetical protein
MKLSTIFSFLLLFIGGWYSIQADPDINSKKSAFSSLFPSCQFVEKTKLFGNAKINLMQIIPNLRGRQGFINISEARIVTINDSVVGLAFSVFLCDKKNILDSLLLNPLNDNPLNAQTLLQVMFFDLTSKKVIGKPMEYPLISNDWICTGDICDQTVIDDLQLISDKRSTFALYFSRGMSDHYIQFFSCSAGDSVKASPPHLIGDLSGESGCTISKTIIKTGIENDTVFMYCNTLCDNSCAETCKRITIVPGKSQKKQPVLYLGVIR